jgi:hypothetical protein
MFHKIFLLVMNTVMLYIYQSHISGDKSSYPKDGWGYVLYIFFYDIIFLIIFFQMIFSNGLKDKLLVIIFILSFILQNLVTGATPLEIPSRGMYVNIFLVVITIISILYEKYNTLK